MNAEIFWIKKRIERMEKDIKDVKKWLKNNGLSNPKK